MTEQSKQPTKVLIIVDVQNDFVEGGALGVTGGKALAKTLPSFVKASHYAAVITSRDAHLPDSDNGGHFNDHPDYQNTWPVHCVQGSHGYDYAFDRDNMVKKLPNDTESIEILKGQGTPSYSAFEGSDENGVTLSETLAELLADEIDVCGIATDYCVKATVLDALKIGYNVHVLLDLCVGVDPSSTEKAITEMTKAGAVMDHTSTLNERKMAK